MIRLLIILLVLSNAALSLRAADEPMSAAVMGLRVGEGVSSVVANMVAKSLREQMQATGAYQMMTPPEMAGVFTKNRRQVGLLMECQSARCIAKLGKLLGVKKIVDGTILKSDSGYALQIRLVDVATMSDVVVDSAVVKSSKKEDVIQSVVKLASRLAKEARPVESSAGKVGFSEVVTVPEGIIGERFQKGVGLFKAKKYEEAMENLTLACESDGGNENLYAEANAIRGLIYQFYSKDDDRYRKAYLAYKLALEWNPDNKIARQHVYEVKKMKEEVKIKN